MLISTGYFLGRVEALDNLGALVLLDEGFLALFPCLDLEEGNCSLSLPFFSCLDCSFELSCFCSCCSFCCCS